MTNDAEISVIQNRKCEYKLCVESRWTQLLFALRLSAPSINARLGFAWVSYGLDVASVARLFSVPAMSLPLPVGLFNSGWPIYLHEAIGELWAMRLVWSVVSYEVDDSPGSLGSSRNFFDRFELLFISLSSGAVCFHHEQWFNDSRGRYWLVSNRYNFHLINCSRWISYRLRHLHRDPVFRGKSCE